jgi:hypothetical protein
MGRQDHKVTKAFLVQKDQLGRLVLKEYKVLMDHQDQRVILDLKVQLGLQAHKAMMVNRVSLVRQFALVVLCQLWPICQQILLLMMLVKDSLLKKMATCMSGKEIAG